MRLGFDGLSMLAQDTMQQDPFSGNLFVFRGKRGISVWPGPQSNCFDNERARRPPKACGDPPRVAAPGRPSIFDQHSASNTKNYPGDPFRAGFNFGMTP